MSGDEGRNPVVYYRIYCPQQEVIQCSDLDVSLLPGHGMSGHLTGAVDSSPECWQTLALSECAAAALQSK